MYFISLCLGTVVGAAGTVLGGAAAMLIGKRSTEPRVFLAFAGGLMVSVVVFEMLMESAVLGGILTMCSGAVSGAVFFALLSPLVIRTKSPTLYSTGLLVLAGIALHNLPEGIAIGSSLVHSKGFAISLSLLMLAHNVPEGIAVCLPLRLSGLPAGTRAWACGLNWAAHSRRRADGYGCRADFRGNDRFLYCICRGRDAFYFFERADTGGKPLRRQETKKDAMRRYWHMHGIFGYCIAVTVPPATVKRCASLHSSGMAVVKKHCAPRIRLSRAF